MIDAVGRPQSVLLVGGSSDIALAIAQAYAAVVPGLHVTVAARPSPQRTRAVDALEEAGCEVLAIDFDACDRASHRKLVAQAAEQRDIDLAVVAYGVLGDPELAWGSIDEAERLAQINYVAPVLTGVALGEVVRRQGHGTIVAMSSVAGERPRRSNFVYGSTKAGFDAFYTGLGEALRPLGGRVLVVRPGFVKTKMTQGLAPAPLAVTAPEVASAVVDAVTRRAEQVWVPSTMRPVMSALRHLPRPIFRRLPI
jgi:decaprenylphospho-beta-D-erythro-pentofuranosid-2-ulose 2-reductase